MLDVKYPGKYKVTNMGACGSTMMKVRRQRIHILFPRTLG